MGFDDMKGGGVSENWCVIIQSYPPKLKKELAKRLVEIFDLEKKDAERTLGNTPLILVDSLSFATAARIKNYFSRVGATVETTNHDMIKKNCYQILWPEMPDLSFFLKEDQAEAGSRPAGTAAEAAPEPAKSPDKTSFSFLKKERENAPEKQESFSPPEPADQETEAVKEETVQEVPETPAVPTPSPDKESVWEKRAKELSERLAKIQSEKQQMKERLVREEEKMKQELQAKLAQERERNEKAEREKAALQESEAARSQQMLTDLEDRKAKEDALNRRVRELEEALSDKESELAKKEKSLANIAEKFSSDSSKVEELQRSLDEAAQAAAGLEREKVTLQEELAGQRNRLQELESQSAERESLADNLKTELETVRNRENELLQKVDLFQKRLHETEDALRGRDEELEKRDQALAGFEKEISQFVVQAEEFEGIRQEHAQFAKERATIRQDYEARFAEQEARIAKIEEEGRRYRSRMERKVAAATRELGEWVRGVEALRQGLQKLSMFIGSDAVTPDAGKKSPFRSLSGRTANSSEKPS